MIGQRRIAGLAVALLLVAGSVDATTHRRASAPSVNGMSDVRRVVMIILENTDAAVADAQPYLSELAQRGATLRDYHALTHPSQPNYIALVAGDNHGVTGSDPVTLNVRHLGDLLESK